MSDFVHLHVHTTYSLLDGQCQIVPLVKRARELGMRALAVTDHGNLFAIKSFYDECRSKKEKTYGEFAQVHVKPILGCEAYVTNRVFNQKPFDKTETRSHLILLAKNLTGYHNLVRLMSRAHIEGFYNRARIDHELLEKYHEGLICSSACIAGEVARAIKDGRMDEAEKVASWYKGIFGDDYYLEVMLHKSVKTKGLTPEQTDDFARLYAEQTRIVNGMIELGKKLDIKVIATNDVHFLDKADDDSHDVLLCLSSGKKLTDPKRMVYTGEEWFKTGDDMAALFPDHPEFLANTLEIADKVEEYELDSPPIMPKFPIPESFGTEETYAKQFDEEALRKEFNTEEKPKNFERLGGYDKVLRIKLEADYLAWIAWEGCKRRWGDPVPADKAERVQFELDTIKTMGFPGYFLIVHDYINAARAKLGVWVGPGRGSAAGSAVAYALGITNVDPIKFDLLFERFLNPDRISMPDIDVDFDDSGRGKVLQYVVDTYGQDHVAHIVTFGQMAAKSAIKDVGRVMEYPLPDTNKLASYVPDTPKITFKKAEKESPDLKAAFESKDPVVHTLMERARRLEGCIRQPGIHACGILISRDPLLDTLPVMPTPDEPLLCTQYDGHFVEPVGLLKMDFLGLKTLTVEKECVELLKEVRGIDLNPDFIPDDDKETYELFGRGETTGLFQFESDGMKKYLRELQPDRLDDLVAMNALYRPGPLAYIPTFIARKQGREPIRYDHPLMEKYLKNTYGVTVYQEQVMLLSRLLGGFTRGQSDTLRKAMGKKNLDLMQDLFVKFEEGCLKNPEFVTGTVTIKVGDKDKKLDLTKPDDAKVLINKIWEDWKAFASYAFNKSHAVCYAWVAYQTGYMKAHYPAEFMCAQISSEIGNFDKLPGFVQEAKEIGLDVLPPDVNESLSRFAPDKTGKKIRYGLAGIKGVGSAAADAIVAERKANGPFAGFIDFAMRMAGTTVVNKRVLENLVRTGAFDFVGINRGKMFDNVDWAIKRGSKKAEDAAAGIVDLFGDMGGEQSADESDASLVAGKEGDWTPMRCLQEEHDNLGIYASGHPLGVYQHVIGDLGTFHLKDFTDEAVTELLEQVPPDNRGERKLAVRVAGMLTECQVRTSKADPTKKWLLMTLDEGDGKATVFGFGKTFEKYPWLPTSINKPVMFCGDIGFRPPREGEEKGERQFILREAYPLDEATRRFSNSICFLFRYADPELMDKVARLQKFIPEHRAVNSSEEVQVKLMLRYPEGTLVTIDLGDQMRAAPTYQFLVAAKDAFGDVARFEPIKQIFLEPPKKRWGDK